MSAYNVHHPSHDSLKMYIVSMISIECDNVYFQPKLPKFILLQLFFSSSLIDAATFKLRHAIFKFSKADNVHKQLRDFSFHVNL